jgi:transposase-like protein
LNIKNSKICLKRGSLCKITPFCNDEGGAVNLEKLFCPNIDSPARGQTGQGNIGVHSRKEKRAICNVCNKSFATSGGTIFYRLRTDPQIVMIIIVLLANGCPLRAATIAFNLDERAIKNWWQRAGVHGAGIHNHLVGGSLLDLGHVQADEIKVKVQGGSVWMALAMMAPLVSGWRVKSAPNEIRRSFAV